MSMNKYTEAEQALNPNGDGTDVCLSAAATTQDWLTPSLLSICDHAVLHLFCTLKKHLEDGTFKCAHCFPGH